MNIWENAVITNKGLALLTKLISGETLNITRGETGSGYVTPGTLANQTAVTNPMQEVSFREVSYPETRKCALTCFITNDGVNAGYIANQIGIYASDPDEGEILFFITQATSGKGVEIPANTEMPGYSSEWTFYFQYGQADGVSVEVDPSNTVSFAEMETYVRNQVEEQAAPKDHDHSIDDFSGVLPVEKGGTGASSASAARTNLGINLSNLGGAKAVHKHDAADITSGTFSSDRFPTLPITKGGTGAADSSKARENLGLKVEYFIFTLEDGSTVTKGIFVL